MPIVRHPAGVARRHPQIVAADTNYVVQVGSFQNSTNGFCQLTVTYDTKP